MNLELKDYQTEAARDVLLALADARASYDSRKREAAVSLTAVTGAGKTVIAASVLEQLLTGGPGIDPVDDLTVLWITDDPSLNEQTRTKLSMHANEIMPSQLVPIDEQIDQAVLDPRTIYFLNIQKLGKSTSYVQTGNHRQHSLWRTIRDTIRERGSSFLLVIDEAHRGTSTRNGERRTIASRLMDGDGDAEPAAPLVFGISATPERFEAAVTAAGRLNDPVRVSVEDVRESGLIKDVLELTYPIETQPGDTTLIKAAVAEVRQFEQEWADHAATTGDPLVSPILVVQLPTGATPEDAGQVLATIHDAWDGLTDAEVAHCLQDHSTQEFGHYDVRYLAPEKVHDDPHARVVLFKEALTTGWDCPRAEVMISLRSATDTTYIAQLIGRMVRTPLAARIADSERLNTVALYLPHFDADSVSKVISDLGAGDDRIASDVVTDAVKCVRNDALPDEVWQTAAALPTYTRPRKVFRKEVTRLMTFAHLLEEHGLVEDAADVVRALLVGVLDGQASSKSGALAKQVADYELLSVEKLTVDVLAPDSSSSISPKEMPVDSGNVRDLFAAARRTLGDGLADWWWSALCERQEGAGEPVDHIGNRITVAAIAAVDGVVDAVEQTAATQLQQWKSEHLSTIASLRPDDSARFYAVFEESTKPEQIALVLPGDIIATPAEGDPTYPKHLYAPEDGDYPVSGPSGPERQILDLLIPGCTAWYRNPTGGSRALGVPYQDGEMARTMYPDFVFFYDDDGEVVTDIIDPHGPNQADTSAKWTGLAQVAADHPDAFRRVLAVIEDDDKLLAVDLRRSDVAQAIADADGEDAIRAVFRADGGQLKG